MYNRLDRNDIWRLTYEMCHRMSSRAEATYTGLETDSADSGGFCDDFAPSSFSSSVQQTSYLLTHPTQIRLIAIVSTDQATII